MNWGFLNYFRNSQLPNRTYLFSNLSILFHKVSIEMNKTTLIMLFFSLTYSLFVERNSTSGRFHIIFPDSETYISTKGENYSILVSPSGYYTLNRGVDLCQNIFEDFKNLSGNNCQNYFCNVNQTPKYYNNTLNLRKEQKKDYYGQHLWMHQYCTLCQPENVTKFKDCVWYEKNYCKDVCQEGSICIYYDLLKSNICFNPKTNKFNFREDDLHLNVFPIFLIYGPDFIFLISSLISIFLMIFLLALPIFIQFTMIIKATIILIIVKGFYIFSLPKQ